MSKPLGGNFKRPAGGQHRLGPMQRTDGMIRRFSEAEAVDFLLVGMGAAGGVLIQRLARGGFKVIGMEAGPFWDTEPDWVSDEAGSRKLYWEDLRIIDGANPLRE